MEYLDNAVGACKCPTCERPLTVDLQAPAGTGIGSPAAKGAKGVEGGVRKQSILNRMDLSTFQSSTKLEALYEEIDVMLVQDPSAKCIVFSQFTSMLDLVQFRLQQVCPTNHPERVGEEG
jgi:DNA repair protein RAD16